MKKYTIIKEYVNQDTVNKMATKNPSLYEIIMHQNEESSIHFITTVLEQIFYFNPEQIKKIVHEAYEKGKAVCGIFTKEVAETKLSQVKDYARINEHPLICSMEAQ